MLDDRGGRRACRLRAQFGGRLRCRCGRGGRAGPRQARADAAVPDCARSSRPSRPPRRGSRARSRCRRRELLVARWPRLPRARRACAVDAGIVDGVELRVSAGRRDSSGYRRSGQQLGRRWYSRRARVTRAIGERLADVPRRPHRLGHAHRPPLPPRRPARPGELRPAVDHHRPVSLSGAYRAPATAGGDVCACPATVGVLEAVDEHTTLSRPPVPTTSISSSCTSGCSILRSGARTSRARRSRRRGRRQPGQERPVASYGVTRRYFLRTYGCQMNEHDSERIAGLLEADGLERAARRARRRRRRAQHVLHPRERRQQALRQARSPEGLEGRARRPPDRRVRLPRPEGPRPRATACGPRRRRARHAQRAPRRRTDRRRPHRRADHRDPRRGGRRRSRDVPVRAAGGPRHVVQRVGHDPDRMRQQLRLLHRARGPWRGDEPSVRRRASTRSSGSPPTASPRSRSSGRTSTATAATSNSLPGERATHPPACVRCSPTCSAPPAPSRGSAGSATRRRTRRTCAPRRSPRWPRPTAVCEHLHYPMQSGSDRVLAAMHRGYTADRYLERLAAGAGRDRRPGGDHRHHRRLPRRDRRRLRAHARGRRRRRVRRRVHVHLLAAPGHRGRARWATASSIRPWPESASNGCASSIERSALAKHEARVGRIEEVLVTGPSKRDPSVLSGRTRQNKLVHFAPVEPVRTGSYADVEITGAAPHFLRGRLVAVSAEPAHRVRIPVAAG